MHSLFGTGPTTTMTSVPTSPDPMNEPRKAATGIPYDELFSLVQRVCGRKERASFDILVCGESSRVGSFDVFHEWFETRHDIIA